MSRKIYLLRHGNITDNTEHNFIGQQDLALSQIGLKQVSVLYNELSNENIQTIISSDLLQCRQTTEIIAQNKNISIYYEPEFREISLGVWEGLTPKEIENKYPGEYAKRGLDRYNYCPFAGESFADLTVRVLPKYAHWVQKFPTQNILIVTHLAVIKTILFREMAINEQDMFSINLPYASYATILKN